MTNRMRAEVEIRLVNPVLHDGVHHTAGTIVSLPRAAAEPLIEGGDAVPAQEAPEPETADDPGPGIGPGDPDGDGDTEDANGGNGPDRHAILAAAIGKLEPDNDDHWTSTGKPEIRALGAVSGLEGISAAERDAAWAAVKASPAAKPPSATPDQGGGKAAVKAEREAG